ncbi:MAG: macro domain-containing protein [Ignavibacteriae bacterium]|nr:macro domain-containing protein [Ignavibacteriota bacterium]
MTKFKINKSVIEIVQGDIAEQETEAIVNAANNHLWMGAGVAGALKRKGGAKIEQEAIMQGPVEIGHVVATSAGNLKVKFVFHAAVMGQDLHTDAEKIKTTTRNTLKLAEEKNIPSLSFPALGTGIGGFEIHYCAKLMLSEAIDFLQKTKCVTLIRFVLFDKEAFDAFNEELHLQFSVKRHN